MFKYIQTPLLLLFIPFLSYFAHGIGASNFNSFTPEYVEYSRISSINYGIAILLVITTSYAAKYTSTIHAYIKIATIIAVFTVVSLLNFRTLKIGGAVVADTSVFFFEMLYISVVIAFYILESNKQK